MSVPVMPFVIGGVGIVSVGAPILIGVTSPWLIAASSCAIAIGLLWFPTYPMPLRQVLPFWWDSMCEEFRPRHSASISATALADLLRSTAPEARPLIVDCRLAVDFRKGHIPGAINVPFYDFAAAAPQFATQRRGVVVHCYMGYYQQVAARKLMRAGVVVTDLVGGFDSWRGELELGEGAAKQSFNLTSSYPIYMDNHSTTPLDPRVLAAMMPFLTERFGNAASGGAHRFGADALDAVEQSRAAVALAIGARQSDEIVFTSGATESNNLAIKGVVEAALRRRGRAHVVTSAIEHPAVLEVCERGVGGSSGDVTVTVVAVDGDGRVSVDAVRRALTADTVLVSIMTANNEIGVVQPIGEIGALCRARNVLLHTDAAQALGRVPLDVEAQCVDLLSLSAHKAYGPKGVGALYVRSGVTLRAQLDGGGHEAGRRSGTLNVPGIVGLGHACALAHQLRDEEPRQVAALRDRLQARLAALPGVQVTGSQQQQHRLPGTLHITTSDSSNGGALVAALAGTVAVSAGAACASAKAAPSHVLAAIGIDSERAKSAVRIGLGRFNTRAEVDRVAAAFESILK